MEISGINVLSDARVRKILESIFSENIPAENIHVSNGGPKGEGFSSLMTKVYVTTLDGKTHHFLIKHAPKDEIFRTEVPIRLFSLRENYFYDTVLPAMQDFTKTRNANQSAFVKTYFTSAENYNEVIVMEDARTQGFRMWDRKKQMDHPHTRIVLEEYGRLHGTSFALQRADTKLYDRLASHSKACFLFNKEHIPHIFNVFDKALDKVIKLFNPSEEIYKKLVAFKADGMSFMRMVDNRTRPNVFLHGDAWCNNFLFKYKDDSSIPTNLRFIDFQLFSVASPVLDISYFLYTSCPKEILDKLDDYLKIYHNSLSKQMQLLGYEADDVYSYSMLKDDWKMWCQFGFTLGLFFLKTIMIDDDEFDDVDYLTGPEQAFSHTFSITSRNEALAEERLKNLCLHMFENGFL